MAERDVSKYHDKISFRITKNAEGSRASGVYVASKHGAVHISLSTGFDLGAYLISAWADTVAANFARAYHTRDTAYLGHIEVDVQARGSGEGSRLLRAALGWLDEKNVAVTVLYVLPGTRGLDWRDLIEWCGRHGFKFLTPQLATAQMVHDMAGETTSRAMFRIHPRRPHHRPTTGA